MPRLPGPRARVGAVRYGPLALLAPPLCAACGALAGRVEPLCPRCRGRLSFLAPEPFEVLGLSAWAPVAYEGPARELVRALKYRGARLAAEAMAAQIASGAPAGQLRGALVAKPSRPAQVRRRSFEQAALIAAALGRRTGLAAGPALRHLGAGSQVGRDRAGRLAALAGAVALEPGATVPDEVVVVDDVITTGATAAACVAALRAGGARRVVVVAYARAMAR